MSTLSQFFNNSGRFRNNRRMYLTAGSYSFTVPNGISEILGVVIGAGGGAKSATGFGTSAPGGGGGGYAQGVIAVTPGQVIAVTVGARGAGGAASASGSAGASSSLGSYLSATGGGGSSGTTGGTGGSGSTSGVSEAFTSSGGTASDTTGSYQATGGASSGSPYGNGSPSSYTNSVNGTATAGAGWNGLPQRILLGSSAVAEGGHGTAGYGAQAVAGSLNDGGSRGGPGLFAEFPASEPGAYAVGASPYLYQAPQSGVSNIWWFPWEIGGSGGAGIIGQGSNTISAGSGGCGAGGGSASSQTNNCHPNGGNGGFGGGGGGATGQTSSSDCYGGSGGVGGGGGGASHNGGTRRGGDGGPGGVLIYW